MEETNLSLEKSRLEKMQAQISNVEKKVDSILVVLVGDELTEEGGYVSRVKVLETRVDAIEKQWEKVKYFIFGAVLFSGYGAFELVKKVLDQ